MNLTSSSLYLALAAAGVLLLGCILWWYRSRHGGSKRRQKPHKSYYGQRPDYAYFSKHGTTQVR